MDSPLTYIDLFAGAGGFSLGFNRAGFHCVGVVEYDAQASRSYGANFPHHRWAPLCLLGPDKGNILSLDKVTVERGLHRSGVGEVDVLLAGPPCQGFSKVGRGKLDDLANQDGAFRSDPRNRLYLKFLEVLGWVRPKAFLFENVPGILSLAGCNEAETICELATGSGYNVACTILDSALFGVPQIRERVFIFGLRADLRAFPSFPQPVHRVKHRTRGHLTGIEFSRTLFRNPEFFKVMRDRSDGPMAVTVQEALHDLPKFREHLSPDYRPVRSKISPRPYRAGRPSFYAQLMRNWDGTHTSDLVVDHFCRRTPRDYGTFALMQPGDKYPQAVEIAKTRYERAKKLYREGIRSVRPRRKDFVPPYPTDAFDEKWRKLIFSQPSWTITAHLARDCYSHIHYDSRQRRALTVREAARLQSFPDAFQFYGNMGDCFRQIGNAVPPLLAFSLAQHVRKLLMSQRQFQG